MQCKNFHETGYGWNYFYQISKTGKVRVGRYWTNGATNSNEQNTRWGDTPSSCEDFAGVAELVDVPED